MVQDSRFRIQAAGFTLVEILVVIGMLAFIGTLTFQVLGRFRSASELDSGVRQVIALLRTAQSKTLAAESDTRFGVHFERDRAILFRGASYTPTSTANETVLLPRSLVIDPITLSGGGADVLFDRLTGRTAHQGNVTIRTDSASRVVTIEASGQVRPPSGETLPVSNTRLVDSRHVNFDLGWSIQNATTLRLVFANPPGSDVAENILFSDVCSSSPWTACDWSGEIAVGGVTQSLRVHTISISATGAVLSIHRDRRMNTRALLVSITDGGITKDIVSYTETGTTTIGAFGGVMTVQ